MKAYLDKFNNERLAVDNPDEEITMAALLGEIWLRSPFMTKLVRKTSMTLREFIDRANEFVNVDNTLKALTNPQKIEMENTDKRVKYTRKNKKW